MANGTVNIQNIMREKIGRRAGGPEAGGKRVLRELSGHNPMPQGDQGALGSCLRPYGSTLYIQNWM